MPHSWHFPTGLVLEQVSRLAPNSICDIGAGYGKWGFLLRELLDWNPGRLDRRTWAVRIDGVEAFPYESPLHSWVYDQVIHADLRDIVDAVRDYDLVLMGDVLEHFTKDDGLAILSKLVDNNRNVIITTPLDFMAQDIADNPFEEHLSVWDPSDFDRFVADFDIAGGAALVVTLAGRGATYPTTRNHQTSKVLYRLVGRRGSVARLAKQLVRSR